jgi:hypothetical protein
MTTTQVVTCEECGSADEVTDGLCYSCYGDRYVWCGICQQDIDIEDALYRHRHIFPDPDDGSLWIGPGGQDMTPEREEDIKRSFFAVLDKAPALAPMLRCTLRHGAISLQFYGTIFGAEGVWCPVVNDEGRYGGDWGHLLTEHLIDDEEEAMSLGVRWLASLYKSETAEANETTAAWISAWMEQQS